MNLPPPGPHRSTLPHLVLPVWHDTEWICGRGETPCPQIRHECPNHQTASERTTWRTALYGGGLRARTPASEALEADFTRGSEDVRSACWAWTDRVEHTFRNRDALALLRFDTFHAGRCAMCGQAKSLREDHDPDTGLVRGLLCYRCFQDEGQATSLHDRWARYRFRPPARILDIQRRYPWAKERGAPWPKGRPPAPRTTLPPRPDDRPTLIHNAAQDTTVVVDDPAG